jgi:effector-binding domain-containing protein
MFLWSGNWGKCEKLMVMPHISFETIQKTTVASRDLTGSYENFGKGLSELQAWLNSKGIKTNGKPMGLFYDNPFETPSENLRSKACIPISGNVVAEGNFKIEDLPGGLVAKTRHEGKPAEYTQTYGAMLEWLLNNGYNLLGPAREIFQETSPILQPGMGVEIQQPVSRTG